MTSKRRRSKVTSAPPTSSSSTPDPENSSNPRPGTSSSNPTSSTVNNDDTINICEEDEDDDDVLPSKKAKILHSVVHREYIQEPGLYKEKETVFSKCKHCKNFTFHHKNSSELKRHLRIQHPPIYRKVCLDDEKQYQEKAKVDSEPKNRNDKIVKAYNKWVYGTGQSFSISDHVLFKNLINVIDESIQIPGRKGTFNAMIKEFESMKVSMKKMLEKSEMIHMTMDMWSSKGLRYSYLGCTVHLFDSDSSSRKNFILCLREFEGSHTAKQIIKKVLEISEEFEIRKKIGSITTDGGRNIRRAILDLSTMEDIEAQLDSMEEISEDCDTIIPGIDESEEELSAEVRKYRLLWIYCFCHKLQCVVLRSIKVMNFDIFKADY